MTNYFRCGKCSEVFDEKYADKHENITWLGALEHDPEDEKKKKPVDKMATAEEFEKKLNEIEASFKKQGITDEDELIEKLRMQIEEMKNEGKKGSKEASRKKYSIIGYDNAAFNYNAIEGDCLLKDLGSVDN